jgi:hypothetical protein
MTDPGRTSAPDGGDRGRHDNQAPSATTTPSSGPSVPADAGASLCCLGVPDCPGACPYCELPGTRPAARRHCLDRHDAEVAEQLRRRRDAADRSEPLGDGLRDPRLRRLADAVRCDGLRTRLDRRRAAAAAVADWPRKCPLAHPHDLTRCPR